MNIDAWALALHALAAMIWVGGMFFAYMALRPVAATLLEPPLRLPLWAQTFARFFPWVWAAVITLPAAGYLLVGRLYGGLAGAPVHVHLMQGLGWVMIALFAYVYFLPYRRLQAAVAAADWPAGGAALARIRRIVGINLILGLIVVAVATGGRYA